ncbi:hypothetical protein [Polaromonas hydrogenivorans]|uniref:Uncharacterized protein n=1 Tax=Polaromonas hydrogenivorans TaxID=335476 RepID=A0AAU7LV20_9BURK
MKKASSFRECEKAHGNVSRQEHMGVGLWTLFKHQIGLWRRRGLREKLWIQ